MVKQIVFGLLLSVAFSAYGKESDPGKPDNMYLLEGCTPAYETMDPDDFSNQWWFRVDIKGAYRYDSVRYTLSNKACCQMTREMLVDLIRRLNTNLSITVTLCM